jgi:fumarate hydratase class II
MPDRFIRSLGFIKAAAAKANGELGALANKLAKAIYLRALAIAKGQYHDQFPVDVFQTGSGTSTNMNVNEVIASLASQLLERPVQPNDDVNCSQSSNDVIPTSIHVSASLAIQQQLMPALKQLQGAIASRDTELVDQIKTGARI